PLLPLRARVLRQRLLRSGEEVRERTLPVVARVNPWSPLSPLLHSSRVRAGAWAPAEASSAPPDGQFSSIEALANLCLVGGVAERSTAAVSKTVTGLWVRRGFKSLPLRQ